MHFDLSNYIETQKQWSEIVFGKGKRTLGILDHIKEEIDEVKTEPEKLEEWIDIIILALDGAWRAGHEPEEICMALTAKQLVNMRRKWDVPASENEKVKHVREPLSIERKSYIMDDDADTVF